MSSKVLERLSASPSYFAPIFGLCRILLAWCCPPERGLAG